MLRFSVLKNPLLITTNFYDHKFLYRIANSEYVIYTNSVPPLGPVTTMDITKEAVYAQIGIILLYPWLLGRG